MIDVDDLSVEARSAIVEHAKNLSGDQSEACVLAATGSPASNVSEVIDIRSANGASLGSPAQFPSRAIDLRGMRFGRLLVLRRGVNAGKCPRWVCLCDCGAERLVYGTNLKSGKSSSCGCLRDESCATKCRSRLKHGHCANGTETVEYVTWQNIHDRCYNPRYKSYHRYGGRGIGVCLRWHKGNPHGFENFLGDMGLKPIGFSIDRMDNDGNYEPENCRWATTEEQNNNKAHPRRNIINGRFMPW